MKKSKLTAFAACFLAVSCATYTPYTKYTSDTENADIQANWGALNTHDPKLFQDDDGTYYVYSTDASIGNVHKRGLQVRTSKDLVTWTSSPNPVIVNWDPDMLAWMNQTPATATTWAPTVLKQNGKYYMFHGLIAEGALASGPTAWIGLAIADSPFGPFEPAHKYDPATYKQSALVRYAWEAHDAPVRYEPNKDSKFSAYIGGEMNQMTVSAIRVNGGKNKLSSPKKLVKGNWTDIHGVSYTGTSDLTGDWTVEFDVKLDSVGPNDWEKWAFVLYDETTRGGWYLRGDSYSNNATAFGAASNFYGSDFGASVEYTPRDGREVAALYRDGMRLTIEAKYDWNAGNCTVKAKNGGTVIYTAIGKRFTSDTVFDTLNTSSFDTATTIGKKTASKDPWAYGFGCIDPEFVTDVATNKVVTNDYGDYYMTYGSWKGGIALITVDSKTLKPTYIDKSGNHHVLDAPLDTKEGAFGVKIAGGEGAAYEGAQLIFNSETGYYYLFVSMGDLTYEYRVGVGRSKSITGPYLDTSGRNMNEVTYNAGTEEFFHNVGGKIIGAYQFKDERGWRSPGGQSILRTNDGKIMFANHTRTQFLPSYFFYMQIHQMFFSKSGWPMLNQNEYDGEAEMAITREDVLGNYDVILTERSSEVKKGSYFSDMTSNNNLSASDGWVMPSVRIKLNADGTVSGAYSGRWSVSSSSGLENALAIKIDLQGKGHFEGYVLFATDFSRNDRIIRDTVTFTTLCNDATGTANGEYFFGNQRNYR
ncbi:family 43 glycosylhydrolase [Treponema zioleckii]|uniref:family 43 glycosylhydrolase n=1 Tax=Treponema zioleckii TaxID=331680 RepID=UPI00168AA1F2|nr:family 43 glycosylhydrolase [Treponema zioleckii]